MQLAEDGTSLEKHSLEMDYAGCFLTMLEAAKKGNPKFSIFSVLHLWCVTEFGEDIEDEQEFNNHTSCRLLAALLMRGFKRYHILPPRKLIPLYKATQEDIWWDITDRKAKNVLKDICNLFNLEPNNYIL